MNEVFRGETRLLVIGYGNTLRSDDGVGPRVAQEIEALGLEGVKVLARPLLTPELAAAVSETRMVVFVDAALEKSDGVALRALEPAGSLPVLAHAADPRSLLTLARDVFGHAPQAWWLTIPVENLDIGEEMSQLARRGIAQAIVEIQKLQQP